MSGGPGQPATGRRYEGLPVPFFFRDESAKKFRAMDMRDDDVIMCSLGKGGTTWMHKILFSLLHGIDDAGQPTAAATEKGINSYGQLYPEALPPDAQALAETESAEPGTPPFIVRKIFGPYSVDMLLEQPAPRIISTHLFGEKFLPEQLLADDGKGRLVIVLRNLKDVLASLHFFNGEPKDGWLGNEHGPGSFARFIDPDSPNAYGSSLAWVKAMDDLCKAMSAASGHRVCVVYFEALKQNLLAQLDRIAAFLGLGVLTDAKRSAVASACGFDAMKAEGGTKAVLLRKGGIGDWKNHLTPEHWAEFDTAFDAQIGDDCSISEPLRHFQHWEIRGKPPLPNAEQAMDSDPRTWESFVRVTLVNGMVVRDEFLKPKPEATGFVRPPSEFNGTVVPASAAAAGQPPPEFVAEAGRYHLFLSGVCPWASSVAATRWVLGLQDVISVDIADGQSDAGWCYLNGTSCEPWAGRDGPFYAHELYQMADPCGTSRITTPILWDTKTRTIVSNDSWNIVKMLATAFAPLGTPPASMPVESEGGYSAAMVEDIEAMHAKVYSGLLNAVYRAGIGFLKGAMPMAEAARVEIASTLDDLETILGSTRFLLGPKLTVVDLRLAMTLLRYDSSYLDAFVLRDTGAKGGILVGSDDGDDCVFPNLRAFTRDVYSLISPTVFWPTFRQYYRWSPGGQEGALPDLEAIAASAAIAPPAARLAAM